MPRASAGAAPGVRSAPVALITGASSGIGEEVARLVAAQGWSVILAGRSADRLRDAQARIARAHPGAELRSVVADLSDSTGVGRLIGAVKALAPALRVLVNNAGAMHHEFQRTSDGWERTFALNVLAPFALTEALIDPLAASGAGRVVNVSSTAHVGARIRFDDLDRVGGYTAFGAYGQSKLAVLMLTYEAARRHRGIPVTFNACHPGFVRSRFGDGGSGLGPLAFRVLKGLAAISVPRGALTPAYLATSREVEGVTGAYFVRCRSHRSSRRSMDAPAAARLWEICAERWASSVGGRAAG